MSTPVPGTPSPDLHEALQGVWWLLTREDLTKDGQKRIDPVLGANPIGILAYAKEHFSAQFMRREKTDDVPVPSYSSLNNTSAADGYDAYFGNYLVDEKTGRVMHALIGSVVPANIGMRVSRDLRVNGNTLIIQLETTRSDGEAIIRTLTWQRIS